MIFTPEIEKGQPMTSCRLPFTLRIPKAFTLLELLACIAIVVLLAALLMPVLKNAQTRANTAKSISNLRAISGGISLYMLDNQNRFPTLDGDKFAGKNHTPYWSEKVTVYLPAPPNFKGPGGGAITASTAMMDPLVPMGYHHNLGDYGGNDLVLAYTPQPTPWVPGSSGQSAMPSVRVATPSKCIIVATAGQPAPRGKVYGSWALFTSSFLTQNPMPSATNATCVPDDRGTGKILSLFVDGHTEAIPISDFSTNRMTLLTPN